ncbi:thermonuclease family protein [Nocardioides sp. LS1]|uniref:thermonuclease family protein n=1 Tax=Nocardioides sp. LS1 TaxID=1027620 RepID=UPI001639D96E|nr:thermonuclease family protein [Nocardioides sp. LS1]
MALAPGSTLSVGVDTTVRLLEIDTPESVDPNSPLQCFAKRASDRLAHLLPLGSHAWALPDRDLLDPYDRALLYLWTADGTFVNLAMVKEGQAKAVLYEPNDLHIQEMRRAERSARLSKRGLWGACDYFGQPAGLLSNPAPSKGAPTRPSGMHTDPRFDYCYEANAAGFGNYVMGRDPEYAWYDDNDRDGVVCEF